MILRYTKGGIEAALTGIFKTKENIVRPLTTEDIEKFKASIFDMKQISNLRTEEN